MNDVVLQQPLRELALFAGAGGGILGGHLLGWRTVCACERAAHPRSVLLARQRDGILPAFPVWDDVQTLDGRPWRGHVDIVTGGFPCQDISKAGSGDGLDGERSGLWGHMARIIGEVRPRFAFVENSPVLTSRGLGTVLGDLAELGYNAEWDVLGADDFGGPHERKRIWILAYTNGALATMHQGAMGGTPQATGRNASGYILGGRGEILAGSIWQTAIEASGRPIEPPIPRVADGLADQLDRVAAAGNGQVPIVAALAFQSLYDRVLDHPAGQGHSVHHAQAS